MPKPRRRVTTRRAHRGRRLEAAGEADLTKRERYLANGRQRQRGTTIDSLTSAQPETAFATDRKRNARRVNR